MIHFLNYLILSLPLKKINRRIYEKYRKKQLLLSERVRSLFPLAFNDSQNVIPTHS